MIFLLPLDWMIVHTKLPSILSGCPNNWYPLMLLEGLKGVAAFMVDGYYFGFFTANG